MGRGYHNAPEMTGAAFLKQSFRAGRAVSTARGTLPAWTPEGELLLQGREDGQIKLRGQRIELEEIASRLEQHPSVRQAAVRPWERDGNTLLAAYILYRTLLSPNASFWNFQRPISPTI